MTETIAFNKNEIFSLLQNLAKIFSFVRLVDIEKKVQYVLGEEGKVLAQKPRDESISGESIASKALAAKTQINKFEFLKKKIFFVTAKYITVDGKDFVLESVAEINNDSLFRYSSKDDFIKRYNEFNDTIYKDPLSQCYNKQYYTEHQADLNKATAIARIDIDLYKQIKQVYGDMVAESAIKTAGMIFNSCVRKSDTVIRLEDEKFIIYFYEMKNTILKAKLEEIRAKVERTPIPQHPAIKLSISVGGYFSTKLTSTSVQQAQELLLEAKKELNKVVIN